MGKYQWEGIRTYSDEPFHDAVFNGRYEHEIEDRETREAFRTAVEVMRSLWHYLEDNDLVE